MKSVCKKYGALFILDEVMSGMGRECDVNVAYSEGTHSFAQAWERYMHGRVSVMVRRPTFRPWQRVLVEGKDHMSNSIAHLLTPNLVMRRLELSSCRSKSQTGCVTVPASGSMGIHIR